jgi:hypothetical protein
VSAQVYAANGHFMICVDVQAGIADIMVEPLDRTPKYLTRSELNRFMHEMTKAVRFMDEYNSVPRGGHRP